MACKPCEERWRIILAQQSKLEIMKKEKEEVIASGVDNKVEEVIPQKLDVDKLIAERRAKIESNKIIRK